MNSLLFDPAEIPTKKLPTKIFGHEKPIDFAEDFKIDRRPITFTAKSFNDWVYQNLPEAHDWPRCDVETRRKLAIKIGDKYVYKFHLPTWSYERPYMFSAKLTPTRTSLNVYKGTTVKEVRFDNDVYIPVMANSRFETMMSLAPNEVYTLRGQVRRAKGNVGIAGLGMGWVVRKILPRLQVTSITVYENDPAVIKMFGEPLRKRFKLTIINADAYTVDWSKHDVVLWDIWDSYGEANGDSRYFKIKKSLTALGKTCIGWGEGVNA